VPSFALNGRARRLQRVAWTWPAPSQLTRRRRLSRPHPRQPWPDLYGFFDSATVAIEQQSHTTCHTDQTHVRRHWQSIHVTHQFHAISRKDGARKIAPPEQATQCRALAGSPSSTLGRRTWFDHAEPCRTPCGFSALGSTCGFWRDGVATRGEDTQRLRPPRVLSRPPEVLMDCQVNSNNSAGAY